MEKEELNKIVKDLKQGKFKLISNTKISEKDLYAIAEELKKDTNFCVDKLINIILLNNINEDCDWNIGSILQHFNYNDIIKALDNVLVNKRGYLYDSIGFC